MDGREGGGRWGYGRKSRSVFEDASSSLVGFAGEELAQGTVEYAIVLFVFLALLVGVAAIWRAGSRGAFTDAANAAASHAIDGEGALDISLY